MASNYAWQFFLLGEFVTDIKRELDHDEQNTTPSANALSSLGQVFSQQNGKWPDKEEKSRIGDTLSLVQKACGVIGIDAIDPEIERLKQKLDYEKKDILLIHFNHLGDRISDELRSRAFVHITSDKLSFYKG
jgi:hypothetical protein